MARKRSIDPDIWFDDRFTELSFPARFLYLGLISIADDEGRLAWSVSQLKHRICAGPATTAEVESWMGEIVTSGLMRVYTDDGRQFAFHPSWHKHQFTSHALESKFPDPPGIAKRYVRGEKGVVDTLKSQKTSNSNDPHAQNSDDLRKLPETAGNFRQLPETDRTPPPQLGMVMGTVTDTGSPLTPTGGKGPDDDSKRHDAESDTSAAPSQRVPRPLTEPFGFADWFFAEAFAHGLLGYHEPDSRDLLVSRDLGAAEKVLKNGVGESQIRGRRYLLALKSGELTKCAPTVRGLLKAWDFGCVRVESKRKSFGEAGRFGSIAAADRDGASMGAE